MMIIFKIIFRIILKQSFCYPLLSLIMVVKAITQCYFNAIKKIKLINQFILWGYIMDGLKIKFITNFKN